MKRNIQRLKSATARRTLYTSQIRKQCATNKDVDSDYGENCQRPDMTADDYALAKSEHINKITLTEQATKGSAGKEDNLTEGFH